MDPLLLEYLCRHTTMDEHELAFLLDGVFQYKQYRKGSFFARQGEAADKVGFAVKGLFSMEILKENGAEYIKSFIKPKEFLLATFDESEPNPVSILTLMDSAVLEAKYSDVKILFAKCPQLEGLYKKEIERETELAYLRLEQSATLQAGERYELFKKQFSELEDAIPQYLIASYLGITPTQLSRIRRTVNKCK